MIPLKVRIDKTEIHALFPAANPYPMPGETFTFDARTFTVHTVAHTWHHHEQAIIATATRTTP